MDSSMKASTQCASVMKKGKVCVKVIKEKIKNKIANTESMNHLEYCTQVWSQLHKDTAELEKVCRKANKIIRGLGHLL